MKEPIRERWRDARHADADTAERLFRRLASPGLSPEELARVRSRVEQTLSQGGASAGGLKILGRTIGARGLLIILCMGGLLVLGARLRSTPHRAAPATITEPVVPPPSAPPLPTAATEDAGSPEQKTPAPLVTSVPESAKESTKETAKTIAAPSRLRRSGACTNPAIRDSQSAPPSEKIAAIPPASQPVFEVKGAQAAPAADDPTLGESPLLSAAVQQLRRHRDPKAALGILDTYDTQFPQGQLRPEAVWLRVQAMVELGQRAGALKVLDAQQLSADPERSTEPLVLRGTLRGEAGRCAEAIADFDAAATQSSGELLESILLHRGGCRARVGDLPGARADYSVYLVRFPTGRYTSAVEAALRALPGATER